MIAMMLFSTCKSFWSEMISILSTIIFQADGILLPIYSDYDRLFSNHIMITIIRRLITAVKTVIIMYKNDLLLDLT